MTTTATQDDDHTRWATYATDSLRNGAQPLTFEMWIAKFEPRLPDQDETDDVYLSYILFSKN